MTRFILYARMFDRLIRGQDMYALVEIKGKQYRAEKGGLLEVDYFGQEPGDALEFNSVLMVSDEGNVKLGKPYIAGAKVTAVIEKNIRGPKILVLKYKRRKSYQRKQGHRQNYTVIKVEDLVGVK